MTTVQEPMLNNSNHWIFIGSSDTVIIFIHGLFSGSKTCWAGKNNSYWPEIIRKDEKFNNISIFVTSYETNIASGSYGIDQCAKTILDELRIHAKETMPLSYSNIILVCHSLGGVIARRMLEQYREYFSGKNIGLVLLASPSLGSEYSKIMGKISRLYGQKQVIQLEPNSETLTDLDNRFRDLVRKNQFQSFVGAEACENHGPLLCRFLPLKMRPIVDERSASRYFGGVNIIAGTDHSSISKPDSLDHPSHKFLRVFFCDNFLEKVKLKEIPALDSTVNTIKTETQGDPLFDLYNHQQKNVYIQRESDNMLSKAMEIGSAWLYGSSGTGKTTLAKRWILENGYNPIEITLSQITRNGDKYDLFQEVAQHLEAKGHNIGNGGFVGCLAALSELSKNTVVTLFIDEVPLSETVSADAFPSAITSLLDGVKRRVSDGTKFIVCSIIKPNESLISSKMCEQFTILPLETWKEEDLLQLVQLITRTLNISIVDSAISELINASKGSPRFIKIFFRHNRSKASISHEEALIWICETQRIVQGKI